MTIDEAMQEVIKARKAYQAIKAHVDALRQEFTARYAAVFHHELASKQAVAEAEATLRALALDAYMHTGTKTLAPGVVIREMTRLHYDRDVALAWAMQHKLALVLDVKTFEQLAKILPLPFVKTCIEPQATLARNFEEDQEASHG